MFCQLFRVFPLGIVNQAGEDHATTTKVSYIRTFVVLKTIVLFTVSAFQAIKPLYTTYQAPFQAGIQFRCTFGTVRPQPSVLENVFFSRMAY